MVVERVNITTFFIVTSYVKHFLPKVVSVENVTGLLSEKHRKHLQKLVREFIEVGYSVVVFTVDASHYGDPQERERVILFASRIDHKLPEVPEATHGQGPNLRPVNTAADAIEDLENVPLAAGIEWVVTADGKKNLFAHWKDDRNRPQSDADVTLLEADRPAPTVLRRNYIEHYSTRLPLSIQERARLMSIPDSFQFFGSRPQVSDMIGNGVPVRLSTALGHSIRESFCYNPTVNMIGNFARSIGHKHGIPL